MKLNVKAFALTCGLVWGVGLFLLTWWIIAFHGASGGKTFLGLFYLGYNISPLGSEGQGDAASNPTSPTGYKCNLSFQFPFSSLVNRPPPDLHVVK